MDNNLDLQYALDADIETAFDSFVDAIYDEVMNDEMKTTIQDNGQCLYRGKEVGL